MDKCGTLRPPVVDESTDPGVLKEYIKEKLTAATINPHFKIRVPEKFLEAKSECLEKVKTFYKLVEYKGSDSCVSCNLKEEWECTKKLRDYFDTVRTKITTAMFGEDFHLLTSNGGEWWFEADLKIRYYPENGPQQLGAHVDGNFITLLWSDRPGLQFPKESEISGLSPADVRAIGLPSLCPPMVSIKDDMWEDVAQDPEEIVVTIGNAFFEADFVQKSEFSEIQCPVLHRVHCSQPGGRFSIPYLFCMHEK